MMLLFVIASIWLRKFQLGFCVRKIYCSEILSGGRNLEMGSTNELLEELLNVEAELQDVQGALSFLIIIQFFSFWITRLVCSIFSPKMLHPKLNIVVYARKILDLCREYIRPFNFPPFSFEFGGWFRFMNVKRSFNVSKNGFQLWVELFRLSFYVLVTFVGTV